EAIGHLEKSIAIVARLRPDDSAAAAYSEINLGSIYESLGDYARAEDIMRKGIAAIERETPDEPQLDFFRGNLARTLMFRGKYAQARALLEKALAAFAARDGERSIGYAFQLFRLARVEFAAGNVDQSESLLGDAAHTLDALLPPAHPLRAQI